MIVLALKFTPDESGCAFEDMEGSWGKPYVGAAVKEGFVSGVSETSFAPDLKINREQAATMVARAMHLASPQVFNVFTDDLQISEYAKGAVYALKDRNIIQGTHDGVRFEPKMALSRAEAAKIIYYVAENQ